MRILFDMDMWSVVALHKVQCLGYPLGGLVSKAKEQLEVIRTLVFDFSGQSEL